MREQDNIQFGRVPYGMIDAGLIADLKPAAAKVYLVLLAHADQEWRARVGMRRMAKLAGVMVGSVSRSVAQLRSAGLIDTNRVSNGQAMTYWITTASGRDRSPVGERLSVHSTVNGHNTDRSPTSDPTVHPRDQNRSPGRERNRGTEIEQQQSSNAAAGNDDPPCPIRRALIAAGVGDPARSELAELPGITAKLVRDKAAWCRERGKGPPVLIDELRLTSEQHTERERQRQARQATAAEREPPPETEFTSEERRAEFAAMRKALKFPNASRDTNTDSTSRPQELLMGAGV